MKKYGVTVAKPGGWYMAELLCAAGARADAMHRAPVHPNQHAIEETESSGG